MRLHPISWLLLPIGLSSFHADAESIYKTIDPNGNVSYSSSPPTAAQTSKTMTIQPPPSDNDIKTAKERHQQNLRAEKIYSDSRQEREQKIADEIRLKKENKERYIAPQIHEEPKNEGPYYGIPGHGILVLPKRISN